MIEASCIAEQVLVEYLGGGGGVIPFWYISALGLQTRVSCA